MQKVQTYPIFGEVDPQWVMQLVQQFHKFLPLFGREGLSSVLSVNTPKDLCLNIYNTV